MYEKHWLNVNYPISFSKYNIKKGNGVIPHWHENIEIIYVTEGELTVCLDAEKFYIKSGDVLVVNSNIMHQYSTEIDRSMYYCLIISIDFLNQLGLNFSDIDVKKCLYDNDIILLFTQMEALAQSEVDYYRPELCADALKLASVLLRKHKIADSPQVDINKKNAKIELVKKAIIYMKKNYDKKFTLEDICEHIGFTKCYFCHTFKEVTGMSAIRMLNYIRCKEAKRMLMSSDNNVEEAALKSGFTNPSYFTKTYKEIMGQLPSQTKERTENM